MVQTHRFSKTELIYIPSLFNTKVEVLVITEKKKGRCGGEDLFESGLVVIVVSV